MRVRNFERQSPSRDAKSIFIFCEGVNREYDYFHFFTEVDSRVNVEIYPLQSDEDNSPLGLFEIAEKSLVISEGNPQPKYSLEKDDEVWIVLDTDTFKNPHRHGELETLYEKCKYYKWNVAESNPCFEVWLYYHFNKEKPSFSNDESSKAWKSFLNDSIRGGFNPNKHPIHIADAVQNAEAIYSCIGQRPEKCCTSAFLLGKTINSLLRERLIKIRTFLGIVNQKFDKS
jgi:hypothetical protein